MKDDFPNPVQEKLEDFPSPPEEVILLMHEIKQHQHKRQILYGNIEEQLDKLYKDINAGLFGEEAKSGEFFTHIHSIKSQITKVENIEEKKAKLEQLMSGE